MDSDDSQTDSDTTTVYLDKIRDNLNNCQCADCDSEEPTIAILSWLLVICKKCAGKMTFIFYGLYLGFYYQLFIVA